MAQVWCLCHQVLPTFPALILRLVSSKTSILGCDLWVSVGGIARLSKIPCRSCQKPVSVHFSRVKGARRLGVIIAVQRGIDIERFVWGQFLVQGEPQRLTYGIRSSRYLCQYPAPVDLQGSLYVEQFVAISNLSAILCLSLRPVNSMGLYAKA